ncbi:hypothetical protein IWX91DRAFT_123540 [Phyllosticta citricarpa]
MRPQPPATQLLVDPSLPATTPPPTLSSSCGATVILQLTILLTAHVLAKRGCQALDWSCTTRSPAAPQTSSTAAGRAPSHHAAGTEMPAIPPIFDNESPSLAHSSSPFSFARGLRLFGSHQILPDGSSLFANANPPSSRLVRRQQFRQDSSSTSGYIPLVYDDLNSGPSPGAVVGIVLGAVIGFLLVVWLFYAVAAMGGSRAYAADEEVVVRERRPRSTRSRRSRRSSRPEIREISRSPGRRQRIVVEERRSSVPPAPRPRSRSVVVEERVSERERRVDGDDIVEVIEETSPPRRVSSRRNSGYRSVDPDRFAGGNFPQRPVPSNGKKGRTTTTRRTIID